MSLATIYKGSDEIIEITVTTDGTTPIDLNTVNDILIVAYQTKEDIIQSWQLSDSTVIITDASNGVCKVYLDRDNTINLPEKRLNLQGSLKLVDSDFEDSFSIEIDIVPLCNLLNSV